MRGTAVTNGLVSAHIGEVKTDGQTSGGNLNSGSGKDPLRTHSEGTKRAPDDRQAYLAAEGKDMTQAPSRKTRSLIRPARASLLATFSPADLMLI
jgi:hypothetical protein